MDSRNCSLIYTCYISPGFRPSSMFDTYVRNIALVQEDVTPSDVQGASTSSHGTAVEGLGQWDVVLDLLLPADVDSLGLRYSCRVEQRVGALGEGRHSVSSRCNRRWCEGRLTQVIFPSVLSKLQSARAISSDKGGKHDRVCTAVPSRGCVSRLSLIKVSECRMIGGILAHTRLWYPSPCRAM